MIIGNLILADEVLSTGPNQTILNGPNNIFPVLSVPAFISFGATIVISGMDLSRSHLLEIELSEKDNNENISVIFSETLSGNTEQQDPHPTLSANLSLRNVRINKIGYHYVTVKFDEEKIAESIINIVHTK